MSRALRKTIHQLIAAAWLAVACWGLSIDFAQAKGRGVVHQVYAGQTLGMIAKRYNVSIAAICTANGIRRRSPIKPGQKLVIPDRADRDGKRAGKLRTQGGFASRGVPGSTVARKAPNTTSDKAGKKNSRSRVRPRGKTSSTARNSNRTWQKYRRPARRAGYVKLRATGRSWEGYAIVKGNKISSRGRKGFRRALYSWRTGGELAIDSRLIRVLVKVSDTFGGRPLKIASGYRERSHHRDSKHRLGRAVDFSIPGVPNKALSDFLKTLPGVGVGYYPNSTFVHVDVRKKKTYWVDLSRPGQPPIYAHKLRPKTKKAAPTSKKP